jgi:hypothetical protein
MGGRPLRDQINLQVLWATFGNASNPSERLPPTQLRMSLFYNSSTEIPPLIIIKQFRI